MRNLVQIGRFFFAIPIIVFGIQYVALGSYQGGLPPVPPWAPSGAVGAYLVGAILIAAGLSIGHQQDGASISSGDRRLVSVVRDISSFSSLQRGAAQRN